MRTFKLIKLQAWLAVFFISSSLYALEREWSIEYQSPVLAERGGVEITQLDFDVALEEIPEENHSSILNSPKQIQRLIESLLSRQYLAQKAIDNELISEPLMEGRLYQSIISELAAIYREHELQTNLLSDYTQQAREIYLKNPELHVTPGEVSFKHILISSENPDSKAKSEKLLARINAGEDLQELASEYSDDPSVQQNMGSFTRIELSQLDPKFGAGIEKIEAGSMGLIESSFGWHIAHVVEVFEPGQLSFEQVSEELAMQAEATHREEILRRLLREAYSDSLMIEEGAIADLLNRHEMID